MTAVYPHCFWQRLVCDRLSYCYVGSYCTCWCPALKFTVIICHFIFSIFIININKSKYYRDLSDGWEVWSNKKFLKPTKSEDNDSEMPSCIKKHKQNSILTVQLEIKTDIWSTGENVLWCTGPNTWCQVTILTEFHIPFSFPTARNQINVSSLVTPLLLLLLHLLVPLAPVKANMLETSQEHSQCLEARLRIAGVRGLSAFRSVNLMCAIKLAGFIILQFGSIADGWWKNMLTYPQDSWDLYVRKQKFLFRADMFGCMQVVVHAITFAFLSYRISIRISSLHEYNKHWWHWCRQISC